MASKLVPSGDNLSEQQLLVLYYLKVWLVGIQICLNIQWNVYPLLPSVFPCRCCSFVVVLTNLTTLKLPCCCHIPVFIFFLVVL
jgi:hypothetical protein